MTDTSDLTRLAQAISPSSPRIREYAIAQAQASVKLEARIANLEDRAVAQSVLMAGMDARIAKLETPAPDPVPAPIPDPSPTRSTGISTGYPSYAGYWTASELDQYFGRIAEAGFRKVRIDYVPGVGSVGDKAVNSARKAGLEVMLIVLGVVYEAANSYTPRCQAAVLQFRDRVHEWQLMNEPNLTSKGFLNGASYATVVRPSYLAIKTLQADSIVHLGSIAQYGNGSTTATHASYPLVWLRSVYTVGRDFFDEVDVHPYGFWRNLDGAAAHNLNNAWAQMCGDGPQSIRQIMVANGDSAKRISITEYGHPTWLAPWTAAAYPSANGMYEIAARDATQLAIADYKTRPYLRDFYVYSYRNRAPRENSTDMQGYFGLERGDGTRKPSHDLWVAENPGLNT